MAEPSAAVDERQRTRAEGRERRCLASGVSGDPWTMIRFVVGPGDAIVPDLAERLPGRGMWVTAGRAEIARAIAKKGFARAARAAVVVPDDLMETLERGLRRRALERLGLARRAGQLVAGFEKTREALESGEAAVLIAAADGAEDGRAKLARKAGEAPLVAAFDSAELGLALGLGNVVHAALLKGPHVRAFLREVSRRSGVIGGEASPNAGKSRRNKGFADG